MDAAGSLATRAWRGGRADWRLHILSTFSISVAFLCLTSALLLMTNLQTVYGKWSKLGRATLYLRDGVDSAQAHAVQQALSSTAGVRSVRFLSSEDSRQELVHEQGDPLLSALPAQAFPAVLDVDFSADLPEEQMAPLLSKLGAIPAVESVESYGRWSERIRNLLQGGLLASGLLALVVLAAVVAVVASTIRLALERRRTEVEVLALVGATDRYVRGPFLVEGTLEGLFGAAISVMLVGIFYTIVQSRWDQDLGALLGVDLKFLPLSVVASVVMMGAVLGGLSALVSLRRLRNAS
jgi:cell division transport system permease protein